MARLLLVGLGPLGRRVLGDLLARGAPELGAVIDNDPGLIGRPLRDFDERAPAGLHVEPALDSLPAPSELDRALVLTSSSLQACAPTLRALLRRGLRVVSSCEELAWPWLRHAQLANELDALARASGGALLGAGINPGFLMDALPSFLSGACLRLRSLRVARVQDAARRRLPFQKKIGAGLDPASFEREFAAGRLGHVGLPESLHFLAHVLGLAIEEWSESVQPILAEEPLHCGLGAIPVGHVRGLRQVARAHAARRTCIELDFGAAIGESEPHDTVELEGDPAFTVRIAGGVHGDLATSALLLNTLDALLDAAPGLHTMASLRAAHSRFELGDAR